MNVAVKTNWVEACGLDDVPLRGARRLELGTLPIAIFRASADRVFALVDRCPHKQGPLSMGIVHGASVTCPLHGMVIDLATGELTGADAGRGCTPRIGARLDGDRILLDLTTLPA
jgi:nitrite reductase (NADH) small subunit